MENTKKKILIIDDNEDIRVIYVDVFDSAGFNVVVGVDGLDGLDKAITEKPDIIFTGIIMPRMDGFALKTELAKNVLTADIPVVMISHMGRKEDEDRAKELGIRDFIVQGLVTPKQAVERVNSVLNLKHNSYHLKIMPTELDASRLASDINIKHNFLCSVCGEPLVMRLEISNIAKQEFATQFVCLNCRG